VTPDRVAVGFRVKSGFAVAVILAGTRARPTPVARRVVELSDPRVTATRQPYHSGFGEAEVDAAEIRRRVQIVERCARASVDALLSGASAAPPTRAALVVGSVIDPASVANPHIRAHANEGRLFRTVLEAALRARDISCDVIVEKQLETRAADSLGRRASEIKRIVAAFATTLGSPWRAEEKSAATAAWVALAPEP
jgi:hypothetical protein